MVVAEREHPLLPNTDFPNEVMPNIDESGLSGNRGDGDGENEVIPSSIPKRISHPHLPFANLLLREKKENNVVVSSSQGSQRHCQRSCEPKVIHSRLEHVTRGNDQSASRSTLSKAKQWLKDPTLYYKWKTKGSKSTRTQSQRLPAHEEEQQ